MNYDQKLAIARIAYRQVQEVIQQFEGNSLDIYFYWDKKIEVEGEIFLSHQLRKPDESDSS